MQKSALTQSLRDAFPVDPKIGQVADHFQMTELSVRRRIADGTLQAYKVGPKAIRIDRDSLANLITPIGGGDAA
jgi:hypothetical protein